MRKRLSVLLLAVLLCGCSAKETFETVLDVISETEPAIARQIHLSLPKEAAVPTMESGQRKLYLCDGYEISVQILPSGDLDRTLRDVTGCTAEDLSLLERKDGDISRRDCAWACVGETGDSVGRLTILDDGNFHYCVSILAQADRAEVFDKTWKLILDSFYLS